MFKNINKGQFHLLLTPLYFQLFVLLIALTTDGLDIIWSGGFPITLLNLLGAWLLSHSSSKKNCLGFLVFIFYSLVVISPIFTKARIGPWRHNLYLGIIFFTLGLSVFIYNLVKNRF